MKILFLILFFAAIITILTLSEEHACYDGDHYGRIYEGCKSTTTYGKQ